MAAADRSSSDRHRRRPAVPLSPGGERDDAGAQHHHRYRRDHQRGIAHHRKGRERQAGAYLVRRWQADALCNRRRRISPRRREHHPCVAQRRAPVSRGSSVELRDRREITVAGRVDGRSLRLSNRLARHDLCHHQPERRLCLQYQPNQCGDCRRRGEGGVDGIAPARVGHRGLCRCAAGGGYVARHQRGCGAARGSSALCAPYNLCGAVGLGGRCTAR